MGESSMNEQPEKPADAGPVKESKVRWPGLSSRGAKFAVWVLLSQLVMTGLAVLWMKSTAPDVVTFDMKGTMDLFIQQTVEQKVPEEQSKQLLKRFNYAMTDSLEEWQNAHNAIILVAPAVVSRQQDITPVIRSGIAKRMAEGER